MKGRPLSFMGRRLASDKRRMLYGPLRKSLQSWHCGRLLFGGYETKNKRGVWHPSCGRGWQSVCILHWRRTYSRWKDTRFMLRAIRYPCSTGPNASLCVCKTNLCPCCPYLSFHPYPSLSCPSPDAPCPSSLPLRAWKQEHPRSHLPLRPH